MILTKKHLNILEDIFDKKHNSIDALEVLENDRDFYIMFNWNRWDYYVKIMFISI